jgi:hypothetical protein
LAVLWLYQSAKNYKPFSENKLGNDFRYRVCVLLSILLLKIMLITILEVVALLTIIIAPLGGPIKKKKRNTLSIDKNVNSAHYAVNEEGYLEKLKGRELSDHEH